MLCERERGDRQTDRHIRTERGREDGCGDSRGRERDRDRQTERMGAVVEQGGRERQRQTDGEDGFGC